MANVGAAWLEGFDKELFYLFAIDLGDAGVDEHLLGRYADLPSREATLAFGSDYAWSATMPCGHDRVWRRRDKLCRN